MKHLIIRTIEDFEKIEKIWNLLVSERKVRHPQIDFQWVLNSFKHLSKPNSELFIIVVKDDKGICAIAPFNIHIKDRKINNIIKLRSLSFISSEFTDQSDLLVLRNHELVYDYIFSILKKYSSLWDEIDFSQLNNRNLYFACYSNSINKYFVNDKKYRVSELEVITKCFYLDIDGDFDSYYPNLSKNLRKDINKKFNRLRRDKYDLNFKVLDNLSSKDLAAIFELNYKRFLATSNKSLFLNPKKFSIVSNNLSFNNPLDKWLLFCFEHNKKIVAYRLCFLNNNIIYDWNTSYDVNFFPYSIGKLLLKSIVEYCFNNNYEKIDFMAGEEDYKSKWTKKFNENFKFSIYKSLKTDIVRYYEKFRKYFDG